VATVSVNGLRIHFERSGAGDVPLVLVHGSWTSYHDWDAVAPRLAESYSVVAYDRRGHSHSERLPGQGSVLEDVADLAALMRRLGLAPAWVVGNSFGASVALRLAVEHAPLLRGVIAHEPPLWGVIADDPALAPHVAEDEEVTAMVADRLASGDHEGGARLFIEQELGPGSWSQLPPEFRATMVENAPTFLDEARDPEQYALEPAWPGGLRQPLMLTTGSESPTTYSGVVSRLADALPHAEVARFEGAGHIPHMTHPDEYVEATRDFILRNEPSWSSSTCWPSSVAPRPLRSAQVRYSALMRT
jgi:pimeloyl-ACP methyl ester carboxylesterase